MTTRKFSRKRLATLCGLTAFTVAGAAHATPQVGTVFYIALENHNFTQPASDSSAPNQLLGNAAAPYLNSLITPGNPNAAQVSYASAYHNVLATPSGNNPDIHPSEPNYVWMEAGTNGPLNDAQPYPNNIVNAPHLSGLMQQNGVSWKSYQEGIDLAKNGSGGLTNTVLPTSQWTVPLTNFSGKSDDYTNPYNGSHQYNYAAKHNPQLFFTDTNGNGDPTAANPEAGHYAPLEQLAADLQNNSVARYNWITPDQYNDMHTALTGGFTYNGVTYMGDEAQIAQGDNFLAQIIPLIMASDAYKNNGAIVIWNDETEGSNEDDFSHTSTEIVLSPLAKGNAFDSTLDYTHSSDLKTLEELFGMYSPNGGFLGDANSPGVFDLSDLFVDGAIPTEPTPEPGAMAAFGLGLAGLVTSRRRRR